jgi:hypothetical protein
VAVVYLFFFCACRRKIGEAVIVITLGIGLSHQMVHRAAVN